MLFVGRWIGRSGLSLQQGRYHWAKVSELQELVPEASIGSCPWTDEWGAVGKHLWWIFGWRWVWYFSYDNYIIGNRGDIPNANTLIENADHKGLSTLYQLRGRVGRSNRIAYAYFDVRAGQNLLTEAPEKRLEAIKGFTELGSGFKIAMRDLSIWGAA